MGSGGLLRELLACDTRSLEYSSRTIRVKVGPNRENVGMARHSTVTDTHVSDGQRHLRTEAPGQEK